MINLNIQLLLPLSQAQYQGADKVRQAILSIFKDRRQRAFDDETLTDAMSRLQRQRFMRFQQDTELSASATSLGNGGGIVEAILVRFEVGLNKLSGNNLGLEPRLLEQSSPVLRTRTCLEGNPTGWSGTDELFQL
ncbi:hypothetical protein DYB13_17625 [Vibrio cholerae]|nr:hypothetical protein [Vibrio cholerae]EGR2476085.1 hypothetical protein [Vibrio cholerae]KFD84201.1 hypothetical protein DN41_1905 [Vibrio cholerae]